MGVNMVLRESFKRTFKKFNMGCTAEQQFYISICSIEEKHRQYSTFSSNFNSFVIYTDRVSIRAKLIVSKMTEIICNALKIPSKAGGSPSSGVMKFNP